MRHLLSASILAAAATWALPSVAATVTYDTIPSDGLFYAPAATTSSGSYTEGARGSNSTMTSPFSDSTTFYDSVGADGKATFGLGLTSPPIFQAAYRNGPASGTFGIGSGTFTFVWGTPDTYNNLYFYSGGSLTDTVTGGSAPTGGNGTNSYLATVSGLGSYDTVVFQSVGRNAFEFAAVSAVPLPASLPMFGLGLLGLGGVALLGRRRAGPATVA